MKKLLLISSLVVASLLYGQGSQPVEITQEDIKIQNEISTIKEEKTIQNKDVKEYFDEFSEANGITYGKTTEGKTFYNGYADITDKSDLARGGSIAFQKAMLNIQAEFIKDAFGRLANERITKYLSDDSSNAREFEDLPKGGTLSQIMDKVTQLAGAKLDKALQDLGINVQGLSEERKKELFKDEFLTKTLVQAYGAMSGLVPVQTFVTTTKRGNYRIGVIAVMSDKTRMFADDIQKNRAPSIKGVGKALKEFLPKTEKGFISEYGIRMVYDEKGQPMIISYGIWSYGKNSTDSRILDRLESRAQEQASIQADVAIREFVTTQINLRDESQIGDVLKQNIKQSTNINDGAKEITEDVISEIIDKSMKTMSTSTKGNIRGIRTVKRWSYTDENGQEYVGAVRVYSYTNYVNTTQAVSPIKQQQNTNTNTIKKSSSIGDRKSQMVNSLDDF